MFTLGRNVFLMLADDVALVSRTVTGLQNQLKVLIRASNRICLIILKVAEYEML